MATVHHIEQIGDTQANVHASLDSLQVAILTDQNEQLVWADSGANVIYHGVANKYWNGSIFTYMDATFDNVTANTSFYAGTGYFHEGDTDTGLSLSTNQVTLQAGGDNKVVVTTTGVTIGNSGSDAHTINGTLAANTDEFVISGDGYLGIGESSPEAIVHVKGNAAGGGTWTQAGVLIENEATGGEAATVYKNGSTGGDFWATGANEDEHFRITYGSDFLNSLAKMTILANGKVGIGTNSPSSKLEVSGDISASGTLTLDPGTQAYKFGNADSSLYLQAISGWGTSFYMFPKNSETNIEFRMYYQGVPGDTDVSYLAIGEDGGDSRWEIETVGEGSGPGAFDIAFRPGGTEALSLKTDGTTIIWGNAAIVGNPPSSGGTLLTLNTQTEILDFIDAGSTGATEQDWIEVAVDGNTGYIRVYASK